jgi:hypothetical protein
MSVTIVVENSFRSSNGRSVGLRSRFRFKSYDINRLPRKQSPHGGAFDEHIGKLLMNGLNHGVGLPLVEISKNTLLPCFKTS